MDKITPEQSRSIFEIGNEIQKISTGTIYNEKGATQLDRRQTVIKLKGRMAAIGAVCDNIEDDIEYEVRKHE